MTRYRNARLGEQFKREISDILARKVRDPRVGQVLVTEVRVTADLWLARVFVRSLDPSHGMEETLAGLAAAAPFVRTELAKVLHIRRIPELRFLHDDTLDSAQRIEALLREVLPPEETEEGGEEDGAGNRETGTDDDPSGGSRHPGGHGGGGAGSPEPGEEA
jgi:ribosome-binding factor A